MFREKLKNIADHNYEQMGDELSAKKEQILESKTAAATCIFTSDKISQLKKIQQLKSKINKEGIDLQLTVRRDRQQRGKEEMRESQRKFNDETANLDLNEKLAHSQRKRDVQEQNRMVWNEQSQIMSDKKQLMKGGYLH